MKAPKMKTLTLKPDDWVYLARNLHILAHAEPEFLVINGKNKIRVVVPAAKAADARAALKARPKPTRLQKMGATMKARHPGYTDNPDSVHIDINSHNTKGRNVRAKNPVGDNYADASDAARELFLFATNDAGLYRRNIVPAIENLAKKMAKGQYDAEKAAKLFGYTANFAADEYAKQHGTRGQKGHEIFKPSDRRIVAREFVDYYAEDIANRASELATKKSRAKNPRGIPKPSSAAKARKAGAAVRAKAQHKNIILVLIGSPKGKGYFTGEGWDTLKSKARHFDTLAGAVAIGKKLAASVPKSYRIEAHPASVKKATRKK